MFPCVSISEAGRRGLQRVLTFLQDKAEKTPVRSRQEVSLCLLLLETAA